MRDDSPVSAAEQQTPQIPNWSEREGRIPLIVGYTGHSKLPKGQFTSDKKSYLDILKSQVDEFFQKLKRDYPNTPLVVVGTLRGEADDLIANVVLGQKEKLPLILILPADNREELLGSLTDEQRKSRIAILDQADQIIYQNCLESGEEVSPFTAVNAAIARYSQIILALRNGPSLTDAEFTDRAPPPAGSSEEVIRFQREGIGPRGTPGRRERLDIEGGMIYHIHVLTEKIGYQLGDGKFNVTPEFSYGSRDKPEARAKEFLELFRTFDQFNRDVLKQKKGPKLDKSLDVSRNYLCPQKDLEPLSEGRRQFASSLMDRYSRADTLAQWYQRWTYRFSWILLGLAFLTTYILFLAYRDYRDAQGKPFSEVLVTTARLLYPTLLLISFALHYLVFRLLRFQERFVDYRGLAEALRAQLFWRIGGVELSVADHYIRGQRGELLWIRSAARTTTWLADLERRGCPVDPITTLERDCVNEHWLQDQRNYFGKSSRRERNYAHLLTGIAVLLILLGIFWNIYRALGHYVFEWTPNLSIYLDMLLALGVVAGTLILTYIRLRVLREHSANYERTRYVFVDGLVGSQRLWPDSLPTGVSVDEWQALLEEIGLDALAENAVWILIHRERTVR